MKKVVEIWNQFNDWMFGWDSPATVAIFRILLGAVAFGNFLVLSVDFNTWFTEKGLYPVEFTHRWATVNDNGTIREVWRLNFLNDVTSPQVTLAFFILVILACLFTCIGLWTRISQVVMVLGIITLHHRSPDILHSGDTLMRNMAILLMFADSGALYSVDRWWKKRKGKVEAEPLMSVWPQRLIELQLATLYLTTVLHKSMGSDWLNGTATWYSMNLREFERFYMPAFTKSPPAIAFSTYFTLVVELAMATLVFAKPLRKWVLLAALALHLGIEYSMNIPFFAFTIISCFVCFYDGSETRAWVRRTWAKFRHVPVPEGAVAEAGT